MNMKKILAILCVALMIGCNGSNTKEPQASLSTDPDSTFLPNGYDMTDIFKTRTGHITTTIDVNGKDITVDDLYLMDITYINSEFRKNHARQVDGVLGTDFLAKYGAVIDYAQSKLYIKIR